MVKQHSSVDSKKASSIEAYILAIIEKHQIMRKHTYMNSIENNHIQIKHMS